MHFKNFLIEKEFSMNEIEIVLALKMIVEDMIDIIS